MNHSRRYQEIKKQIDRHKHHPLSEIISFLQNNNQEKVKNIKATFALNWAAQKQKNPLRDKIILPYSWPVKGKIAVVKDNLPAEIINNLVKNESVELLSVEETHQRIMNESRNKIRKRSQWGFVKLVIHPDNEKKFKLPEKLPPKLLNLIARRVLLNENPIEEVIKFQKGEKEIRSDRGGNIHAVIGKSDFSLGQLTENYQTLHQKINSLRPPKWKGVLLKKIILSTAMGPGLKILI
ncbi:MAG: hypothetical protein I3274_06865 [Candidatus Moeniiplasma glomeromycotorum]|nr:hypothetical protein [Candidatus Moeniiplasma glomeromycotorum]MCE8168246.1 hypothetical protein [Candidatus Moeniiplasma glomeromycotorum]